MPAPDQNNCPQSPSGWIAPRYKGGSKTNPRPQKLVEYKQQYVPQIHVWLITQLCVFEFVQLCVFEFAHALFFLSSFVLSSINNGGGLF